MLVMSHDVFAAKGDLWNAHPEREQRPAGLIVRTVQRPDGVTELSHRWLIEGYGPDGEPVKVSQRRHVPAPRGRKSERNPLLVQRINENAPKWRKPSGEHYHAPEEIRGEAQPLTEEQLLLRKRQRAQVQARMTRACNKAKREREEVWAILTAL